MMEEIAEGFHRLKVLVSELLTVEKSESKIEENGMFVKDLLQQLSHSVLGENVENTTEDVADDEMLKKSISDCDEDLDTSTEFSLVDGIGGPTSVVSEEMASPKFTELDGSDSSSSSSGSCSTSPSGTVQAEGGKSRYEMIREDIIAERNEQLRAMGFFDELSVMRTEMTPKKPLRNKLKSPVKEKKGRGWVRRSERLFLSSSEADQSGPKCKKADVKAIVQEILDSVSQEKKKKDPVTSVYNCDNCGKEFQKKRYLTQHVKRFHIKGTSCVSQHKQETQLDKSPRKRAVYSCDKCNFTCVNKRSMSAHKSKAHTFEVTTEGAVHNCDKCNFVHKSKSNVDRHRLLVHKLDESSVKRNVYDCEECDFISTSKRDQSQHIYRAHKKSVYDCEQCDFSTTNKKGLSKHISRVHKESSRNNVYDCEQCKFSAMDKRSLLRHNLRDHGVKMKSSDETYSCDQCSFVTRHRGNLIRHKSKLHPVDSAALNIASVESDTDSIEIFTDDSDEEDAPVTSSIFRTIT